MNATNYVVGLAKAEAISGLPSTASTDRSYEFSLKWGNEGTGDGQFDNLGWIAVASDGSVYVADHGPRIQKFTSDGVFQLQIRYAS